MLINIKLVDNTMGASYNGRTLYFDAKDLTCIVRTEMKNKEYPNTADIYLNGNPNFFRVREDDLDKEINLFKTI